MFGYWEIGVNPWLLTKAPDMEDDSEALSAGIKALTFEAWEIAAQTWFSSCAAPRNIRECRGTIRYHEPGSDEVPAHGLRTSTDVDRQGGALPHLG